MNLNNCWYWHRRNVFIWYIYLLIPIPLIDKNLCETFKNFVNFKTYVLVTLSYKLNQKLFEISTFRFDKFYDYGQTSKLLIWYNTRVTHTYIHKLNIHKLSYTLQCYIVMSIKIVEKNFHQQKKTFVIFMANQETIRRIKLTNNLIV